MAAELPPETVLAVVDSLMRSAYGEQAHDEETGCWWYSFNTANGELDYCMKPGAPEVVASGPDVQVHLQAFSDADAEAYSLVEPGLHGFFAATVATDGSWQPLAVAPAIDQGQAGDCGCRDAELVQVGPGRYGWLSTSGGVWQGVPVGHHQILVPVAGEFRDVSRIPEAPEDAPDDVLQIRVDRTGTTVQGFYPLQVTRQRDGKEVERTVVAFDPERQLYPWGE